MAPVTPNLAGFADAQQRLRSAFGEDVTFYGAETFTYPAGTPLDPETGEPYDPTIVPESTAQDTATVRCTVAYSTRTEDQEDTSALGREERTHILVICDVADQADVEGKIEFAARGETFKVVAQAADGIAGVQRFLTWGRQR